MASLHEKASACAASSKFTDFNTLQHRHNGHKLAMPAMQDTPWATVLILQAYTSVFLLAIQEGVVQLLGAHTSTDEVRSPLWASVAVAPSSHSAPVAGSWLEAQAV